MAEVGGTATLIEELQSLIDQKKGLKTYVGNESGTTFTAANSATQPRENINIITQAPLGDGNGVKSSICSVTFTKK